MELAKIIEELHRLSAREWASRAVSLGLSYSEFEYLRAIEAEELAQADELNHGQHLQDVVAAMGVRKASASAMVLKLEERELVFRVPCRFDARAQHILLSEKGREIMKAGASIYKHVAKAVEEQFLPSDIAQLKGAHNSLMD